MSNQPNSQLTAERPDIWLRAVALATSVTGLEYVHKAPLPDGTIYACGGGGWYSPPRPPPTPQEIIIREIDKIDRQIHDKEDSIAWREDPTHIDREIRRLREQRDEARRRKIPTPEIDKTIAEKERESQKRVKTEIESLRKEIERLKIDRGNFSMSPIPVPDGAMEWLLHEVGHWVASTPDERQLPDYGYGVVKKKGWGKDREWQAWAFEEIIMVPFGPSRGFAPVEHRGGTAFDGAGWQGIPEQHLKHAYAQILASGISVEQWRALYSEWVLWGTERGIYSPLS